MYHILLLCFVYTVLLLLLLLPPKGGSEKGDPEKRPLLSDFKVAFVLFVFWMIVAGQLMNIVIIYICMCIHICIYTSIGCA